MGNMFTNVYVRTDVEQVQEWEQNEHRMGL